MAGKQVRIDGELLNTIDGLAANRGLSANAYIHRVLEAHVLDTKRVYVHPARERESRDAFAQRIGQSLVLGVRDWPNAPVFVVFAKLERLDGNLLVVRPPGGRSFNVPLHHIEGWRFVDDNELSAVAEALSAWVVVHARPHPTLERTQYVNAWDRP